MATLSGLLAALALPPAGAAELLSDRLVLMEADGRSHTVQHTLFSDAVPATLQLPGSVIPQRVVFGGPERLTFRSAWEARPDRLALWSGSAFARYRHQYGDAVRNLSNGAWRLSVSSLPSGLSIELDEATSDAAANAAANAAAIAASESATVSADVTPTRIDIASTWVFPSDVEVLDWQAGSASAGEWTFEDNSLGWQQRGTDPVALTITYRSRSDAAALADAFATDDPSTAPAAPPDEPATPPEPPVTNVPLADASPIDGRNDSAGQAESRAALSDASPAAAQLAVSEDRAETRADARPDAGPDAGPDLDIDTDGDGVADAQDVCIGSVKLARIEPNAPEDSDAAPLPGCKGASRVVLEGISFDVGQSWLDPSARSVLDRVAAALIAMPGRDHEIAAHTDSQGRWTNNLALSQRRARAVRQYLLLRGVPAGSLSSTGHGESRPITENLTAQGRRENRRIELGPLPAGGPVDR